MESDVEILARAHACKIQIWVFRFARPLQYCETLEGE